MFPLARPYRQVLATLGLFVAAVLPTCYVVATAWKISRAGHLRELEVDLSRRLGLDVSLEGVRYPRPGEVIYQGVVLRQEEPRRKGLTEIARARSVRLRRGDRELLVETANLRLRGESPKLAMAQVGLLLQRPSDAAFDRVSLSAPTCELDLDADDLQFAFRDLAGTFQADRSAPTVRASFRLAAKGSNTRCELTLTRDRKSEPVRTTLAFKTMDGLPLPGRVLDVFFDSADWLGRSARVEGALTLRQAGAKDWEADFQGDLYDVDLGTLVGRRFPSHRLTGLAHLAIKSARWGDRPGQGLGWINASGELSTGQGSLGVGLLNALASEMSFRVPDKAVKTADGLGDVPFHKMGVTFEIQPNGEILLGGALGTEFAPDVVLARQSNPLAFAPRGVANVRGLIKTLVPASASDPVMVPLTKESRVLLCFPAPPQVVPKRIEGN